MRFDAHSPASPIGTGLQNRPDQDCCRAMFGKMQRRKPCDSAGSDILSAGESVLQVSLVKPVFGACVQELIE